MGMYSYVTDDNVQILDVEGLKQFLKNIKEGKYKEYEKSKYLLERFRARRV